MGELDGRVALVTGAGGGIGRAIARALAARGARLWLVGRREEALEATSSTLPEGAPPARVHRADLSRDADVAGLADELRRDGGLALLVSCAGVYERGGVEDAPVADLDAQYSVNLRGPFALSQALLPLLREQRGQIVFISSTAALGGRPGVAQYAATQAALKAMADSLRAEVNEHGVRVLSVFPGRTATTLQERIHRMEGREYLPERLMQPEDIAAMVVSAVELPRTAEVTEITMRPALKPT